MGPELGAKPGAALTAYLALGAPAPRAALPVLPVRWVSARSEAESPGPRGWPMPPPVCRVGPPPEAMVLVVCILLGWGLAPANCRLLLGRAGAGARLLGRG